MVPVERNQVSLPLREGPIGLIGLGVLGRIFASHLRRLGPERALRVYDAAPTALAAAVAESGAEPAGSAGEVAAGCSVLLLSLPSPAAVRAVMGEVLPAASPGTLVIDLSTIDPVTCREMFAAAAAVGVGYLEAPLSGGAPLQAGMEGARAASLSFLCGGAEPDFEAAKPYLAALGSRFFFLGPAGSGATVKLISNLCAGLHNLVAAEAFVLGRAAGFDPDTLLEVFDGTDARSYHMTDYFALRLRSGSFEPGFSVRLQHKDHVLAGELGRSLGVPLYLNSLATQMYQSMLATGRADRDLCDAVNALAAQSGVARFDASG